MVIKKLKCVFAIGTVSSLWSLGLLFLSSSILAQPSTEIMLADLDLTNGTVKNLINISQHPGYDNQPFFTGSGIYFSAQNGPQTEVMQYRFKDQQVHRVTETPGSEYSPTLMPNQTHFSTIVLEADGTQLLWHYRLDGTEGAVLVPELKIGYHCWLNSTLMAAFVLGDPHKLYLIDQQNKVQKTVAENIGRALHKIPQKNLLSYVDKSQEPWVIKSYDWQKDQHSELTTCLSGAEDLTWCSDGSIIMGKGSELHRWTKDEGWKLLADLADAGITGITRLAANPQGNKIALVVEE